MRGAAVATSDETMTTNARRQRGTTSAQKKSEISSRAKKEHGVTGDHALGKWIEKERCGTENMTLKTKAREDRLTALRTVMHGIP